jgi:acetyl-CoA/propionyl-CoA carboxylase biotin carboxyl carrier protein
MATALPFHRAVVTDPAFAPEVHGDPGPFSVHTRWIETEFDNTVEAFGTLAEGEQAAAVERESMVVEVGGQRLEVSVPTSLVATGARNGAARTGAPRRPDRGGATASATSGDAVTAPMQGTIVKVAVQEGHTVAEGDLVVVLEAMKMEQPVHAHRSGTVTGITAEIGMPITSGAVLCKIEDR